MSLDTHKLNRETMSVFEHVVGVLRPSLAKAGVPREDQRFEQSVEIHEQCVYLRILVGVLDLTAQRVFGAKKGEALRSRAVRSASDVRGWKLLSSHRALWRDPDVKMHWETTTLTLSRPRAEFENDDPPTD